MSEDSLEFVLEDVLGNGADLLVHHLSAFDEKDSGDVTNAELHGQVRIFVHVNLADNRTIGVFFCQLFDVGAYLLSWTTPCSPEVNDHRLSFGNQLLEIGICNL